MSHLTRAPMGQEQFEGELSAYWEQGWEGRVEFSLSCPGINYPVFLQAGDALTIRDGDDLIWEGTIAWVKPWFWEPYRYPRKIWSPCKQKGVSYARWMEWFVKQPPLSGSLSR